MNALQAASGFQQVGAFAFGAVVGWYLYFINRHRKDEVKIGDLVTVIGAVGGAAVLALFPAGTDLFAAYGIGLALGFFLYFIVLCILVSRSDNFDVDWFLDGRRKLPTQGQTTEGGQRPMTADRSAPPS
jgi:hypothetical protein